MNTKLPFTSYFESLEVLHERVGALIDATPSGIEGTPWGSLLFAYTEVKNQQKKCGGRISEATIVSEFSAPETLEKLYDPERLKKLAAGESDDNDSR